MKNIRAKVDQLGLNLAAIKDLTKEADKIKTELKNEFAENDRAEFLGKEYRALVYSTTRRSLDEAALCKFLNIDPQVLEQFMRVSNVVSVKVNEL